MGWDIVHYILSTKAYYGSESRMTRGRNGVTTITINQG